ncbi:MAG: DUF1697 domain-containing protein [Tumebacillaceae bacterium]
MAIYIALLRGINVGGKNKIKMAELKQTFEQLGLDRVQTYIQSGNVLFESNEEEAPLRTRIEQGIEAAFGIGVVVVLRTAEEMKRIIENCPFTAEQVAEAEAASQVESLYVALLPEPPAQEGIEKWSAYQTERDQFRIAGRDVYQLFHHSVRDSKLANNIPKLGVPATVRNWKTMSKLVALATAMEV